MENEHSANSKYERTLIMQYCKRILKKNRLGLKVLFAAVQSKSTVGAQLLMKIDGPPDVTPLSDPEFAADPLLMVRSKPLPATRSREGPPLFLEPVFHKQSPGTAINPPH